MGAGKARVKNFFRSLGESQGHLQKQKRSRTLNEILEAVDECRLNGIKKNEATKNSSLFGQNPAEENEKDDSKVASEIGQPGQGLIQHG